MIVEQRLKLFGIRFCAVDCSCIGITASLNAGTDADVFVGNAAFFGFCPMFAWFSGDIVTLLFAFVAVQDKGFVQF